MVMKGMDKVLSFLLIILSIVCGNRSQESSTSPTSPILEFLKSTNLTCTTEKGECTNDEFVGHCKYRVDCTQMTPSVFEFIECDQTCIHPITLRPMIREFIAVQEITHIMEVVITGQTHHFRSAIGCSCILTEKGREFKRRLQLKRLRSTI